MDNKYGHDSYDYDSSSFEEPVDDASSSPSSLPSPSSSPSPFDENGELVQRRRYRWIQSIPQVAKGRESLPLLLLLELLDWD